MFLTIIIFYFIITITFFGHLFHKFLALSLIQAKFKNNITYLMKCIEIFILYKNIYACVIT